MIAYQAHEQQLSSNIHFVISSTFARQGCRLPKCLEQIISNFREQPSHFTAMRWLNNSKWVSVNALIQTLYTLRCHEEVASRFISVPEWPL